MDGFQPVKTKKRLDDVAKNKMKAIIAYTARTVALMCASGTLMQTFLASLGFESSLIYLHSTLLQAANVLTIILASNWANNGSPIKKAAFSTVPIGIVVNAARLIGEPLLAQLEASMIVSTFAACKSVECR